MKIFKRERAALLVIILSLNAFLLNNCLKKEEISVYRFIDHLDQKNVLSSPLKELALDPQGFKKKNPALIDIASEFPLEDFGIGENPFSIKKKMKIGLVELNSLLAPSGSNFKFSVKIPKKSFLEFTYGIRRDNEFLLTGEGKRKVSFRIILEVKKRRVELLRKTLKLTPERALVSKYKKIDLSDYGGKKGTFYFITKGSEKALACWFNPAIYQPRQNVRNVVLISLDTLRDDHLSCYGYPKETSPNIDLLAEDSVIFLNAFAPSPWTLPSHLSLMTSLNTINHQVYYGQQKLESTIITLADFLRMKGYFNTAFTGGGFVSGVFGFNKGFDSYRALGKIVAQDSASLICQTALDWIDRNKDKNFFLFLHTYQIHSPYFSPPPYNELFLDEGAELKKVDMGDLRASLENRFKPFPEDLKRNIIALYDGEIRYTDESFIKPLIDRLKELDLYDKTMIILTSDHGEEFYEHHAWTHNHSVYAESIKIPLIIKFFNSRNKGKKVKKFARLIDVMPTILDELKIDYSDYFLEGENLLDLVRDEKKNKTRDERMFISDLGSNIENNHIPKRVAINQGQYKFIINEQYSASDLSYFLFPPPQLAEIEVYDLEKDPDEKINLASKRQDLVKRLSDFMLVHYKQRRKGGARKVKISDEIRKQLKALGYIR